MMVGRKLGLMAVTYVGALVIGGACADSPIAPKVAPMENRDVEIVSMEFFHPDGRIADRVNAAELRTLRTQAQNASLTGPKPKTRDVIAQLKKLADDRPDYRGQRQLTIQVEEAMLSRTYDEFYRRVSDLPVTRQRTILGVEPNGAERSRVDVRVKGHLVSRTEELRSARAVADEAKRSEVRFAKLADRPVSLQFPDEQPCVGECEGGGPSGGGDTLTNGQRETLLAAAAAIYYETMFTVDSVVAVEDSVQMWWNDTTIVQPHILASAADIGFGAKLPAAQMRTGVPCLSQGYDAVIAAAGYHSVHVIAMSSITAETSATVAFATVEGLAVAATVPVGAAAALAWCIAGPAVTSFANTVGTFYNYWRSFQTGHP